MGADGDTDGSNLTTMNRTETGRHFLAIPGETIIYAGKLPASRGLGFFSDEGVGSPRRVHKRSL
jgi:hypothetical protein